MLSAGAAGGGVAVDGVADEEGSTGGYSLRTRLKIRNAECLEIYPEIVHGLLRRRTLLYAQRS